jgi:hypothetical protein
MFADVLLLGGVAMAAALGGNDHYMSFGTHGDFFGEPYWQTNDSVDIELLKATAEEGADIVHGLVWVAAFYVRVVEVKSSGSKVQLINQRVFMRPVKSVTIGAVWRTQAR